MSTCKDDDLECESRNLFFLHPPSAFELFSHCVSLLGCVSAVVLDQIYIKIKANGLRSQQLCILLVSLLYCPVESLQPQ